MKTNRMFAMLVVAALIVLIALTVQEVMATTSVVSEVNSEALSFSNQEGLAIYHVSERNRQPIAPAVFTEEGLAIYHESERNSRLVAPAALREEGLAIYHGSERSTTPALVAVSSEEGLAIYHESERQSTVVTPQRLFNGQPFNAYQRSEWLGEDR